MLSIRKIFLKPLILFFTFLIVGCGKDIEHPVPDVHVYFELNLTMPSNASLNAIGGWEYYTGGYQGIIIYRLSEDEFKAFDRACTHNISNKIFVEDPPMAKCKECGSMYLLLDGSVAEGPAKHRLKEYRTRWNDPILTIGLDYY